MPEYGCLLSATWKGGAYQFSNETKPTQLEIVLALCANMRNINKYTIPEALYVYDAHYVSFMH